MTKRRDGGNPVAIRDAAARAVQPVGPHTVYNPVVAATAFSAHANESGGATMNVRTNAVVRPHDSAGGFIVGGEPGRRGGPQIPAQTASSTTAPLNEVLFHKNRIKQLTESPRASLGYWRDNKSGDQHHVIDASAIYRDRRSAVKQGTRRGENAIFDVKKMADIRLDGK